MKKEMVVVNPVFAEHTQKQIEKFAEETNSTNSRSTIMSVEILRIETGKCASPATWVEDKNGEVFPPHWEDTEKVTCVPAGAKYRVCQSSSLSNTRKGSWKIAR